MSPKNTDTNLDKIASFLSLLMELRLHNTCNQGNKYKQHCVLIYAMNSMKESGGMTMAMVDVCRSTFFPDRSYIY